MKRLLPSALLLLFCATNLIAAERNEYYLCPPDGDARTETGKALNRLKNRTTIPKASNFDSTLTFDRLIKAGNDRSRWFSSQAVKVRAYVVRVSDAPIDSCNCNRSWNELRGTQLELAPGDGRAAARPIQRMIAVVTPRMRAVMKKQNVDWSRKSLMQQFEGKWVEVQGWLLFDGNDAELARNTTSHLSSANRATAWEIHPVTSIKVTEPKAPVIAARR